MRCGCGLRSEGQAEREGAHRPARLHGYEHGAIRLLLLLMVPAVGSHATQIPRVSSACLR